MKPVSERIKEFVKYHITGDGECNGILMKALADEKKFSPQQRFDFAYFYSVTYCIPSSLIMLKEKPKIMANPQQYADDNLKRLIFQSDRRYVRLKGTFKKMLVEYRNGNCNAEQFLKKTVTGNTISVKKAFDIITKWYFYGRFGAFLFIETLCLLMNLKSVNMPITWKDGDTATSGLMNLFGYDSSADYFDKNDKLPPNLNQQKLDVLYNKLVQRIAAAGGETNVTEVETSLCAYRKFYKGSRYNGFYLDRQLEELKFFENKPEAVQIVKDLYRLRKRMFKPQYLGELHDWNGVRKDCKTLYLRTGKVM